MPLLLYATGHNADMYYATKADFGDPFVYLEIEQPVQDQRQSSPRKLIFLDSREYGVYLERQHTDPQLANIETVLLDPLFPKLKELKLPTPTDKAPAAHKLVFLLCQEYRLSNQTITIPGDFPVALADFLRLQGFRLQPHSPIFPQRLLKTLAEVEAIAQAIRQTEKVFALVEQVLRESMIEPGPAGTTNTDLIKYQGQTLTAESLKQEVEQFLLKEGLTLPEGIIIASREQAAIPHHSGSGPLYAHQTIIVDIFPRSKETRYFADMTRTYCKGRASSPLKKMYEAVRKAQADAVAAIKDGVLASDVHQQICRYFLDQGFHVGEKGFTHGTGHGLGLDIHEPPYIGRQTADDNTLQAGMVVTVEPGLYYPELGGVRIEDVVLVEKNGCRNFMQHPKTFEIA